MAWLTKETNWDFKLVPQDLVDAAEEWAKKELADDDDDDDDDAPEQPDVEMTSS